MSMINDGTVIKSEPLRVIVFEDDEFWVAQCLEYDIGAQASDISTLQQRLRVALLVELEASLEATGKPFGGIGPAPTYFHNLWDSCSGRFLSKDGTSITSDGYSAELETALCA